MKESSVSEVQFDVDEVLDKAKICAGLSAQALSLIGDKLEIFQTIDSTNLEAKRRFSDGVANLHGTVLLAEHQSAGRGRLGRSFYSPKKSGIYLSIIYSTDKNKQIFSLDPARITAAMAVAVSRSFSFFGIESKIKWVNDIFVNEKKVCGILAEGVLSAERDQNSATKIDGVVVGIGINVFENEDGFTDELKGIAGTLNKAINRNNLTAVVLNKVIEVFSGAIVFAELMQEYRERSFVLGKQVQVIKPNEQYPATVLEITDEAHLLIERPDGSREELFSGEVSVRI